MQGYDISGLDAEIDATLALANEWPVPDLIRHQLGNALDRWREFAQYVNDVELPSASDAGAVTDRLNDFRNGLGDVRRAPDSEVGALQLLEKLWHELRAAIDEFDNAMPRGWRDRYITNTVDQALSQSRSGLLIVEQLLDAASAKERATSAAEDAERSADAARSAAGSTADAALADHFASYSTTELGSSKFYRALTFVLASAAAVAGLVLYLLPVPEGSDTEAVGHLLARSGVVVALAGLSAYVARLASQHRANSTWATAINVQLKTFDAFVRRIESEVVRDQVYLMLAGRVLTEPPSAGDQGTPSPLVSELMLGQALDRLSNRGA